MATQLKLKEIEIEIRNMVDQIRRGSNNSLYEIAQRIKTLTDNTVIYASQVGIPSRDVMRRLDDLLVDFNVTVETLLVVLKHRPNRSQWAIGINKMATEIAKENRAKARESRPKPVLRKGHVQDLVVTAKQLDESRQQVEALQAVVKRVYAENADYESKQNTIVSSYTARLDEKDKLIARLQLENQRLRHANDKLTAENTRLRSRMKPVKSS